MKPRSRRDFLTLALALASRRMLPDSLQSNQGSEVRKHPDMIVRSPNPVDLETPVELLDSWITPLDRFFVRGHLYTPRVDLASWKLQVTGVEKPASFTLEDLKRLEAVTEVVTMECAGNGRALFRPRVAGAQWVRGAVGTARWTGARLADVLRATGAPSRGYQAAFDGADQPMGDAVPDFIRSVPIEKCWHPATLLAYQMNGQPLPVQHGFPLRVIVPGWEGAASVKWLTRINIQEREPDGFVMATAYRYPNRPVAPGEAVDSKDMEVLTSLDVKSVITRPGRGAWFLPGALVEVEGAAWAGEAGVTRVDVSTDLGRTWQPASLGPDRAPFAWRRFRYGWKVTARGSYMVMSRATDTRGRVQPIVEQWNPSGYLYNVVDPVAVHVGEGDRAAPPAGPAAPAPALPSGPGREIAERACLSCHDATLIVQQRLERGRWVREVEKMIRWGASITGPEKDRLADYLYSAFRE